MTVSAPYEQCFVLVLENTHVCVSALVSVLQEAAREWLDWMAGHKPANSGNGKKLWRQYNEEQLQKVGGTASLVLAASATVCTLSGQIASRMVPTYRVLDAPSTPWLASSCCFYPTVLAATEDPNRVWSKWPASAAPLCLLRCRPPMMPSGSWAAPVTTCSACYSCSPASSSSAWLFTACWTPGGAASLSSVGSTLCWQR